MRKVLMVMFLAFLIAGLVAPIALADGNGPTIASNAQAIEGKYTIQPVSGIDTTYPLLRFSRRVTDIGGYNVTHPIPKNFLLIPMSMGV